MQLATQGGRQATSSIAGGMGGSLFGGAAANVAGSRATINQAATTMVSVLKARPDAESKIEAAMPVSAGGKRWCVLDPTKGICRCLTLLVGYDAAATSCKVVAGRGDRIMAKQKYLLTEKQVSNAKDHLVTHLPEELLSKLREADGFVEDNGSAPAPLSDDLT